jgi:hypothetical protein
MHTINHATTLSAEEENLLTQALNEFVRYHNECAETMDALARSGGNGLVTVEAAQAIAHEHRMLNLTAFRLLEAFEDSALQFVQEIEVTVGRNYRA